MRSYASDIGEFGLHAQAVNLSQVRFRVSFCLQLLPGHATFGKTEISVQQLESASHSHPVIRPATGYCNGLLQVRFSGIDRAKFPRT